MEISLRDIVKDEHTPISTRIRELIEAEYCANGEYKDSLLMLFTIYRESDVDCMNCKQNMADLNDFLTDGGYLTDPNRHIKWIVDDADNLIFSTLAMSKTPVTLVCDGKGRIIDVIHGIPRSGWVKSIMDTWIEEAR
jgi:hypothetical protein